MASVTKSSPSHSASYVTDGLLASFEIIVRVFFLISLLFPIFVNQNCSNKKSRASKFLIPFQTSVE
jgi:hypothetical protein